MVNDHIQPGLGKVIGAGFSDFPFSRPDSPADRVKHIAGDLLDTGAVYGVVSKSGNSYSYGEIKLGVGRENAKRFLRADKKLMKEISKKVLNEVKARELEE